ncbi:cellulase family glycosylhydrolase [Bacteroidota bacterium]
MNINSLPILFGVLLMTCTGKVTEKEETIPVQNYVEISSINPNYFQLSDGSPYIPIGLNMIHPSGDFASDEEALQQVEDMMKGLSDNGGNFVRIWLSHRMWDIEHEAAGVYDESHARNIDRYIALARKYGLRIKMTFEHFRVVDVAENPRTWAKKLIYHTSKGGPVNSIQEYLTTDAGHKLFIDKLDFYQERYGADTVFFGWELWNEMNAVHGPEDSAFFAWNKKMLLEVKKRFPENLAMQSFGSFDRESGRENYKRIMTMQENEVAQIHRYLDLGARMEICHGPQDIALSDAINELRSYNPGRPMILAETGAVEPRHSGPFKHYKKDTVGLILHDALFAPFFTGSAGVGMIWHWVPYVHANNLWFQFGRFSNAIKGVNPIEEELKPVFRETDRLRVYELQGKSITLLWLRDKQNNWKTELDEGIPPEIVKLTKEDMGSLLPSNYSSLMIYDPWKDMWSEAFSSSELPESIEFERSLVLRVKL